LGEKMKFLSYLLTGLLPTLATLAATLLLETGQDEICGRWKCI
jgi:hypothetical protein